MSRLSDIIFAQEDQGREVIDVEQWGVKLEVRSMDLQHRLAAMDGWSDEDGKVDLQKFYPAILVATVFDPETGEQVFDEPDAIDKLGNRNAAAIEQLASVATRLSGMSPKAVDEAGEGSSPILNGDSSST